jgi:hypothetical protein
MMKRFLPLLGAILITVGAGSFVYGLSGFHASAESGLYAGDWKASLLWLRAERLQMVFGVVLFTAGLLIYRSKA